MDTNTIISVCTAAWVTAAAACMFGRSQMVRRFGCMELVLAAAVSGCALFGYLKAADFIGKQYHQMLAISLGGAEPYLADLEDEWEVYGGSDEAFLQEAKQAVTEALPILQDGVAHYSFESVFLVKKDGQGVYRECFNAGGTDAGWERLEPVAVPLIKRALRGKETVWQEYDKQTAVFAAADRSRVAPEYALVVTVPEEPLMKALETLKSQYFFYSLLFMTAATLVFFLVVLMQEKELHRIMRFLARAAKGGEEASLLLKSAGRARSHGRSNEMQALTNSVKQIAINMERMNYARYQVLQAYYRFAPKEIEKILGKQSILDVAPMDQEEKESLVAFVSFAGKTEISGGEYLQQMNRNYALLCEGCREFGGHIVSVGSNFGVMLLLFYDKSSRALRFGMRMTIREAADQRAGQAFVFLHRTSFIYGVAGDEEQSFPYIYAQEIRILQKYTDSLRALGVRMAVTDRVWEREKEEASSRYIGYIEEKNHRFDLYEILDAYPEEERVRRLSCNPRFEQALTLYYKSDFYLARNLFSDILRSCPGDEVAKRYLFLCEDGLNGDKTKRQSFALFSEE